MINPNILNNLQSKPFLFTPGSTAQAEPAPLALIPISQANPLKTNRPQNNAGKLKVREGKGKRKQVHERRGRRIGKQAAISMHLILPKKKKKKGSGAQMAEPPQRSPLSSLLCNREVWRDGGSQQPCPVPYSQRAKHHPHHMQLCFSQRWKEGRCRFQTSEPLALG